MKHLEFYLRSVCKALPLRRSASLLLLLAAVFLLSSLRSFADEQVRAARLSYVYGTVRVLLSDGTEFSQAQANMPLPEGARVQTGNDGRAELQLEDGSVARLTPNSSLSLDQLQLGSGGARTTEIELVSGLGYFELQPSAASAQTSIRYRQSQITASNFAIFRVNADETPAALSVLSGDLRVVGPSGFSVDAHENSQVQFGGGDGEGYYVRAGIANESWDQWNNDRDSALNSEAEQQTAATESASDPNNPAWGDLDNYGSWYDVDGYGRVWTPSGVDQNWDPYGYGYWAWYPTFGYTWVSGYSWGYLPYRCGAWNYFNDFGWGWMPGGCGMGYLGGSVVVWNRPPRYLLPRPPRIHRPTDHLVRVGQPIIRVDRGGASHYKPQPVWGNGRTVRSIMVGGREVSPLTPVHASNGFTDTGSRAGNTIVVGRTGLTRPGRAITANPGQPGTSTWNTVRPQPGVGLRPGHGGADGQTNSPSIDSPRIGRSRPMQPAPAQPMGEAPRSSTPVAPRSTMQPTTVTPAPHIMPPSGYTPRSVPSPSAAPAPTMQGPRPSPTIQSPRSAPTMPTPSMSAPRMQMSAPPTSRPSGPPPSSHSSAPSGPRR